MSQADHKYRADIDGLRAIAVTAVLIYHAFPARLPGGFVGVDVFFVLSGYLISGIILDAKADGRFSFANFYARRIRRIFPALAVVLVAVLAGGWFLLYADDYARVGRHTAAGAAFLSNIAIWQESSYFDVASDLKPLLHLWSLGVEEQFYFVWPVLLVLAARWRRGPVLATLGIGTISLLIAIWTVRIDRTPAFFAPWNRFWELLAGALVASIHADAPLNARIRELWSRRWFAEATGVMGLVAIASGGWLIDSTRVFPGLWALLPVGGAALLILSERAWVNRAILSQPLLVWVGLISYPLYLWHWPLLSFAHIRMGGSLTASLRITLLALSVVLAWATYLLIERRLRFGRRGRLAVPVLCGAMLIIGSAGYGTSTIGGFLDRPINRSDAARLVDYYDRMHNDGLRDAYRYECDFLDWTTREVKKALPASCLERGRSHTLMLWGDSFAQAISLGIRANLPPDTSLAQVATSVCRAQIEDFESSVEDNRCEIADRYAMKIVSELRPDLVILAQAGEHDETDFAKLTGRILSLGARQVLVVGPSPTWDPTLPRVYAENHMADHADYVAEGLYLDRFDVDRRIAARVRVLPNVTYLSLLDHLCHGRACLGRVPGADPLDLMVVDYGHLSPKGSAYLGRAIWKPLLPTLINH